MCSAISSLSFDLQKVQTFSKVRPRLWQTQLINLLRRRLNSPAKANQDILVHAAPGAGKTLGALLGFKAMRAERYLTNFIIFCHRKSIATQWKKAGNSIGLSIKTLEIDENALNLKDFPDGWIITYQGASRNIEKFKKELNALSTKRFLVIADEAHHLGINPDAPEEAIWGRAFLELTEKSTLRIGLTGTPFRSDNLEFCSARKIRIHSNGELLEQINPDISVEPRELISTGDVRPLEFHFQDGWVEHSYEGYPDRELSPLSQEQRESWRARNLRRATHISSPTSIGVQLLLKARKQLFKVRQVHSNAAGLVIARDIEHAKGIANLLKSYGDSVELIHSQTKEANNQLEKFKNNQNKWLVSVDMCSEGFDAPRLRVIAYLTTVVTNSRFLQGITRVVRMSSGRAAIEPIPRNPSYVFAPADPLLMEYARNWSETKPYLIKVDQSQESIEGLSWISKGPTLPMETVGDSPGKVIKMRTAELPHFLK